MEWELIIGRKGLMGNTGGVVTSCLWMADTDSYTLPSLKKIVQLEHKRVEHA